MKKNLTKFENKIRKMMEGSYEPTQADVVRIYKEYSCNKDEISAILSEVFGWLSQEPICVEYKQGRIYMRCEATSSEELLWIHYFYINEKINLAIENFVSQGNEDITEKNIKNLVELVKDAIRSQTDY